MTDEEKVESQVEEASDNAEGTPETGEETPPQSDDVVDEGSVENSEVGIPEESSGEAIENAGDAEEEDAEAAMLAMLEDLPDDDKGASADDINFESPEVSNAQFQHLSEPASAPETRNIDILMDVNLPVAIELGRTRMSISEILGMGPGSVVELNKLAGEPVDVLVNYKIVAKGEVVVIDENFGVRITQLMTPEERLKMLCEED
jgi:flagellar motor switch protein FliN